MGGMIGEATLAMLYVPLFFYLFDGLEERSKKKKVAPLEPSREDTPNEKPPEIASPGTEGGH
jgi:multidrug efflux pump